MKTVLKKILIILLAVLAGYGTTSALRNVSAENLTNHQYVFSRNSSHNRLITIPHAEEPQSGTTAVNLPENTQQSSNWAGYIVTPVSNTGYTSVSGSWAVPNISSADENAVAAQWVGLGGVSSSDLLQMGTVEQMINGKLTAEIFWEKLPDTAQNVMSVPIGSTINVSISKLSDSMWNLTFTVNLLSGETKTKTISVALDASYEKGIGTSAEWISEDPSNVSGQLYPLANMGIVKYQMATVDGLSINASSNNIEPVAVVSNEKTILIWPSALDADGKSFTTTSNNSTSPVLNNRPERIILPPRRFHQNSLGFGWRR